MSSDSSSAGLPTLSDCSAGTSSASSFSYTPLPAMIRVAAVQSWPLLKKPASLTASATALRSASSKTTTGALPPSSRWTRFTVCAAAAAISMPVTVSPVSEIMSTSGCVTSRWPATLPGPVMTLSTPLGKMSAASSASANAVSGVFDAGLSTTVHPAASAGPAFQMAIMSG